MIPFSLFAGDRSINAGMSIPLLSITLATLMAFFRDQDYSLSVSPAIITLLIQESATALLDPRLAIKSELDEASRMQIVRAINKVNTTGVVSFSFSVPY